MPPADEDSNPQADAALAESLAEFERRRAAGEAISEDQWIADHPDLADELRAVFDERREVARVLDEADATSSFVGPDIPAELDYIGSYRLKERLGAGGMGVVFRAAQQGLGRDVAVKVLAQLPQRRSQFVDRFRHEARLAAKLSHPHIVTIFEVGEDKGFHFFSMELMSGGSLRQFLGAPAVDPKKIAQWIMQAAYAVDFAHQRNIVHRDVKPANLLLDDWQHVKVADFGLARDVDGEHALTADGDLLGTLSYMSPEQTRGNSHAVGPLSDVYSLGATLYALLAGAPPIRGQDPASTLALIQCDEPLPLRSRLPGLSKDLATICHKCLEKAPHMRYSSAAALGDDLGRWLNNEPIAARPPNAIRRAARWCRRRPKRVALATLIALGLLLNLFFQHRFRQLAYAANLRLAAQTTVLSKEAGWSDAAAALVHEANARHHDPRLADELAPTLAGLDAQTVFHTEEFGAAEVEFSSDGNRLLLAGQSPELAAPGKSARVWDWRRKAEVAASPWGGLGPVRFAADGAAVQLVVRRAGSSIQWIELATGASRAKLDWKLWDEMRPVGSRARDPLCASRDARYLAACIDDDGVAAVAIYDADAGEIVTKIPHSASVLVFAPNSQLLAAGDQNGRVTVWTIPEGRVVGQFDVGRRVVQSLAFAPDYLRSERAAEAPPMLLAIGDSAGYVTIVSLRDESVRTKLSASTLDVLALAFHPEGTILATGSRGEVRLWNVATGGLLLRMAGGNYNTGLAFSADGEYLAASSLDFFRGQRVSVWRLSQSRGIAALYGLGAPIAKVCFSRSDAPDAPRLVGALSQDWQVGVWEVRTGRLRAVVDAPRGMFPDNAALDFSPRGDRLAFCTGRSAVVWNSQTGEELQSWELPDGLADLASFRSERELIVFRAERDDADSNSTGSAWPRTLRIRQLLGADPLMPVYEDRSLAGGIVDAAVADDGRAILLHMAPTASAPASLRVLNDAGDAWASESLALPFEPGPFRWAPHAGVLVIQPVNESAVRVLSYPGLCETGRLAAVPAGIDANRHWRATIASDPEPGMELFRWDSSAPLVRFRAGAAVTVNSTPFSSEGRFLAFGRPDGAVWVVDVPALARRLAVLED